MRILLVEDDYGQAGELARILSDGLPSTTVQIISTESEFRLKLRSIMEDPPDIAIIDSTLRWADPSPSAIPVPDDVRSEGFHLAGIRLQQLLQESPITASVPVVLYTAFDASVLRERLSKCPPHVVCLSKDSDARSLIRLIRSMLSVSPKFTDVLKSSSAISPGNRERGRVFVSYSHRDKQWLEELQITLRPFVRDEEILPWDDTMIQAGQKWRSEIEANLRAASVAVLLVSRYFFASDFIAQNELPPLLDAAAKGGLTILWIAVSASSFERFRLSDYQAINDPSRPLDSLSQSELNRELVRIAAAIRRAISGPSSVGRE